MGPPTMTEAPMAAGIALISAAGAALLRARIGSGRMMRAGFVTAVVATGFLTALWFVVTPRHAVEYLARMGAIIAAVMTISAAGVQWTYPIEDEEGTAHAFVRVAQHLAILFGVLAGTVLAMVLGVRCIYVVMELITVFPIKVSRDFGFTREGTGSLALLLIACAVGFSATGAAHLSTCIVALMTMCGAWLALEGPVLNLGAVAGMTRSLGSALLGPWLALMLVMAAVKTPYVLAARRETPEGDVLGFPASPSRTVGWRLCCALLTVVLIIHLAYPFGVPLETGHLGFRAAALVGCAAAAMAAIACFSLSRTLRSGNLADGACGLLAIAFSSAAVAAIPQYPKALVDRYPVIFSAVIVGLACAAAAFALLARHWTIRADRNPEDAGTAMLRMHAKRGIFFSGAAAMVVGGMMAFWPRLQGIATADFSLGRVSAGLAANLLLFVVLLVSARMFQRPTYYILAGLAFVSATVFVVVRILPFTPRFG